MKTPRVLIRQFLAKGHWDNAKYVGLFARSRLSKTTVCMESLPIFSSC